MKALIKTILYQPLFNALIFLIWLVPGHSAGAAIIILTIVIRLLLWPSSQKAMIAQRRLKDLGPELAKLKEKYKGDQQAFGKAQLEFYREKKISPFGGCLPLLIQFPILIILYYVFRTGLDTSHFNYLYPFTPKPDTINTSFFGINLSQPSKWVLPILAGGFQFIQSWQMMKQNPNPSAASGKADKNDMQQMMSKQMMYLMPLFTVFIARGLPAALPLYWIVTTVFAIVQQEYVNRMHLKPMAAGKTIKKGVEISIRKKE